MRSAIRPVLLASAALAAWGCARSGAEGPKVPTASLMARGIAGLELDDRVLADAGLRAGGEGSVWLTRTWFVRGVADYSRLYPLAGQCPEEHECSSHEWTFGSMFGMERSLDKRTSAVGWFAMGSGLRFYEKVDRSGFVSPNASSKARGWDIARLEAGWDGRWNHGRAGMMMSWSLGCFMTRTSSDGRSLPDTCLDEFMPYVSFGVGVRGGFEL